jgi:DNA-binding CsgD family transcriptional regulator
VAEYGETLSEREREILEVVATGATNREVAYNLDISPNTVKVHLRNIFTKLGVESRTEATMFAVQKGLIVIPDVTVSEDAEAAEEPAPPPPPLPLWRRVVLVCAAVLALVGTVVAWPRAAQSGSTVGGPLPPFLDPESGPTSAIDEAPNWSERAQMPTRRAGLALTALERRLYAIGGVSPEGVSDAVEVYYTDEDSWERASDKPTAAAYIGAAVVEGKIYVPGGCIEDGAATTVVEVYDPAADRWTEASPLPTPLCAYALAVHEGRIYLFGGTDGENVLARSFSYDPERDRWEQRAAMTAPRTVAAAAALGDRIYVVGGYRQGRELPTCAAYDPASDQWTPCAPLTVGRNGLGLIALSEQLYAIGGGSYLGFNERYDPRNDRWTAVDTPLTGVWQSPGVAMVDLIVYAVGGWSDSYVGLNLAFEPLPIRIFLPVTEGG